MNEQLTPDAQRHLHVLQRYMLAMESGDIDSMAIVLHEAEQDRTLENMLLEVSDFYQQEDHTTPKAADVTLANQLLSLFRVQQFQPVQVTKQDVQTLSSRPIPTFQDMGTLQIKSNSLQTQDNLTQAQAAQLVNFPMLVPGSLPRGISGTPNFSVIGAGQGTFTFSASKAHAFFLKNGYGNINIPVNLDGATFDVTTAAGVVIAYGNQTTTEFMVVEFPSPIVRATGSASLQELRDVALSIPGLPSQLATQLRQIDLNSGVVPLPIHSGIDS